MKSTKILGAVFTLFLLIAFCISSGAAAPEAGSTVYVYEYGIGAPGDTYYLLVNGIPSGTVTLDSTGTLTAEGITEGVYSTTIDGTTVFSVKYPAANLGAYIAGTGSSIAGLTIFSNQPVDFNVSGIDDLSYGLRFTTPTGGATSVFGKDPVTGTLLDFSDSTVFPASQLTNVDISDVMTGQWSAKITLERGNIPGKMTPITPSKYLNSNLITFTVGQPQAGSIVFSHAKITRGHSVLLTITGAPYSVVPVTIDSLGFVDLGYQSGISSQVYDPVTGYLISFNTTLSSSGTRTLQFDTDSDSQTTVYTFSAAFSSEAKNAYIDVEEGVVTVQKSQESYYIGNTITLFGTNTDSNNVYLYIKGSNVPLTYLTNTVVKSDDTWTITFDPGIYRPLDAGTYTIYAAGSAGQSPGYSFDATSIYSITSVVLKQPFLSASADSLVVKPGDMITITGQAVAANQLIYYIFGVNKFVSGRVLVNDDGTYSKEIATTELSAGQYFVVVQHPMYDRLFNIGPVALESGGYDIKMNAQGDYTSGDAVILFNTNERQSANAAEALCCALDTQNIDDIYVKLTFKITSPYLTANSFSSSYNKGELIEITGKADPVADLNYYVFGRETFITGTIPVTPDGQYDLNIDSNLIEGNDFYVVIQHPMNDGVFNVGPVISANGGYDIKMNKTGGFNSPGSEILFNTLSRQGENAAEAICQAIDFYQIDDICTKLYFIASSTPTNIVLSPGFTLQSLTVDPDPSPIISEGTPISVLAYLTIAKDAISTSGSLKLSTDIRPSTSWTVDIYKGTVVNNYTSEAALITSLNSRNYAYTISGFVLDYDQPVTLVINLTGLYPAESGNITAFKLDCDPGSGNSQAFTYSLLYGPKQSAPSFDNHLDLRTGWNFISIPKTLNASNNTFGALFGNVETNNKNILAYNAQTRTWVPVLNQHEIIQPLNGYWIYSVDKTTIPLTYPSDPAFPSMKTLYPGWNAIGLSSDEPASAKTALAGTSWRTLLPWDLAEGKYDSAIVNGGSDANSPNRLMTLGNGYWLYVDAQSMMTGLTA